MFVQMEESETQGYGLWEGCYGTIEHCCKTGAFLVLDNGEPAFAYDFANLFPGTMVLCTVRKFACGDRRKQVTIDSVCYSLSAA